MDVLQSIVDGYNLRVHSSIGNAPAKVTDKDVLAIWKRLEERRAAVSVRQPKYSLRQHVRISRERAKFAKSAEHNFTTDVFQISKVIARKPRPVYELEDLNKRPIDGQFYEEELTPVRISEDTQFQIDKILRTRVKRGIKQFLVRWKRYSADFDEWIPTSYVRQI
jgi:hypothetical protein